jgi:DNA-directed RNA polymerase subunit RPC12/RpoP
MTMQMHSCPRCGAKFDTFEALDHHLFRTHTGEVEALSYRCATCDANHGPGRVARAHAGRALRPSRQASGSNLAWRKRSCGGS